MLFSFGSFNFYHDSTEWAVSVENLCQKTLVSGSKEEIIYVKPLTDTQIDQQTPTFTRQKKKVDSRAGDSSVSLLSGRVPDLCLDGLTVHLYAPVHTTTPVSH